MFDIEDHFLWHHEGSSTAFNLATDGVVLVQGHFSVPHPDLEFEVLRNSFIRVFQADEPLLVAEFGTPTSEPELERGLVQGFPVGDVNGDGHRDIIGTDGSVSGVLFLGPHHFQVPASETVHPGPTSMVLPSTVGGQFETCDLNRDGLSDLCSAMGFALAPAPFENGALLPSMVSTDHLAVVDVPGMHGVMLSSALAQTLHWIPAAALPAPVEPAALAAHTIEPGGWVQALRVSFIGEPELVALVGDVDLGVEVVTWSLDGDFVEKYRLPVGIGESYRQLEVGDWNGDGVMDLALSISHRIGIFLGPLSAVSEPELWWTTPIPGDLALSGYYLAAHGPDLWAYEIATRRLYRITDPHIPR